MASEIGGLLCRFGVVELSHSTKQIFHSPAYCRRRKARVELRYVPDGMFIDIQPVELMATRKMKDARIPQPNDAHRKR